MTRRRRRRLRRGAGDRSVRPWPRLFGGKNVSAETFSPGPADHLHLHPGDPASPEEEPRRGFALLTWENAAALRAGREAPAKAVPPPPGAPRSPTGARERGSVRSGGTIGRVDV